MIKALPFVLALQLLVACTNSTVSNANSCPNSIYNQVNAESYPLLLVNRLDRGVSAQGERVYATELSNGNKIIMTCFLQRFGAHYSIYTYSSTGEKLDDKRVVLPDSSVPMGFAYFVSEDGRRHLVLAHRNPKQGIADPGPYRLRNNNDRSSINYTAIDKLNNVSIEYSKGRSTFAIAERGFCINEDGYLLIPGKMSSGEIYR